MPVSEKKKASNAKWDSENMTTLGCRVKKDQAVAFKAHCETQGSTSNTVLKNFVLGCIGEQEPETPPESTTGARVVSLPHETIEAAQRAAEAAGETTEQFISRAISETMERDNGAPGASEGRTEGIIGEDGV